MFSCSGKFLLPCLLAAAFTIIGLDAGEQAEAVPDALRQAQSAADMDEMLRRLGAILQSTPENTSAHRQTAELLKRCREARDQGRSLLHVAVLQGDLDWVKRLLDRGAGANAKDKHGSTPLLLVRGPHSLEIMDLLLAKGADVKAAGLFGFTPLHMQCTRKGAAPCVKRLISAGADVNKKDAYGMTPLYQVRVALAAEKPGETREELSRIAEMLVKAGADPGIPDNIGAKPLALLKGQDDSSPHSRQEPPPSTPRTESGVEFMDFDGKKVRISWSLTPQQAQSQGFHYYDNLSKYSYRTYTTGSFHLCFDRKSDTLAFCIINDTVRDKKEKADRHSAALHANVEFLKNVRLDNLPRRVGRVSGHVVSDQVASYVIRVPDTVLIFSFGRIGTFLISQIRVYNPAIFPADEAYVRKNYVDMIETK